MNSAGVTEKDLAKPIPVPGDVKQGRWGHLGRKMPPQGGGGRKDLDQAHLASQGYGEETAGAARAPPGTGMALALQKYSEKQG